MIVHLLLWLICMSNFERWTKFLYKECVINVEEPPKTMVGGDSHQ
jgi:hypothetical protein